MLKKTTPTNPTAPKIEVMGNSFNFDLILFKKDCNYSLNKIFIPNKSREGSTITMFVPDDN